MRRAALDPVHVDGRLRECAHVELLGRRGVGRAGTLARKLFGAGGELGPAGELLCGRLRDPGAERLGCPAVPRQHRRKDLV